MHYSSDLPQLVSHACNYKPGTSGDADHSHREDPGGLYLAAPGQVYSGIRLRISESESHEVVLVPKRRSPTRSISAMDARVSAFGADGLVTCTGILIASDGAGPSGTSGSI